MAFLAYAEKSRPGFTLRLNYDVHELYNRDGDESSLLRRNFYSPPGKQFNLLEGSTYYGFEVGFELCLGYRFPNHLTVAVPFTIRNSKDDYQSVYRLQGDQHMDRKDFTIYSKYFNSGIRLMYPITMAENHDLHINLNTLVGLEPKVLLTRLWEIRTVSSTEAENYQSSETITSDEKKWYTDFVFGAGIEFETHRMMYEVRTLIRTNYREGVLDNANPNITKAISYQIGLGLGFRIGGS
ncbi:hypothetical protein GYB22_08690 [bacterium]|nr:hypothetical protein [bacterium]